MRSPALRFALLVLLVGAGLIVSYRLGIVDWLRGGSLEERILSLRDQWWTPLALLGLFVVTGCLPLPATAVVLVAGAVYGPWHGSLFNWLGCLVGAAAGYAAARFLGRDFVAGVLGAERWRKLDRLMSEHGFWAMARARLMLPLAVVNYGGGLGGMRCGPFLASSMLGMTLPLVLYTWIGHLLVGAVAGDAPRLVRNATLAVGAVLLMSLVAPTLRWWRRRGGG
jgi:uncharacterized membrane protein YdjX (TVP38/TMEM64 family)